MTNLDYVKSLNADELISFFDNFFDGKCENCPIYSECSGIRCTGCVETLDIWFKMERTECMFKNLKVGDKFKKNDDIYIKTANGYAFNIKTGEGCFYDENEVCKTVTDIEIKQKEQI